ncbi:zinc ion binding [Raphanus sativus]|uniref:RING-type E3 ubiquitin transferase n=1 Tax=Raphanus sativus TaxID=3726 RepID=A0A6J0JFE7_RAPSA|nr:E3 ubiquitin-protein ligase hel2 isoform X2 [Raphanus sativus]KAJ4892505.1 zinc ion binding [Raphanus sativus]
MEESCAVCAENLEWAAYGFCGHREVCSTCVVRLRFILGDRRCCICKTECPIVFVTKELGDDDTKTITDFSTFPSDPKEGRVGSFWYHEETKVFFDDFNQYSRVKSMCRLSCTSCDKTKKGSKSNHRLRFKSVEHLNDHLNHQHKLHMCSLCLVGRKVFICEQKLFTKEQLNQHISSGDSEVDGSESERGGFTGHPMCEFCKRPFYGGNELYTHMSREHYTCHICQRLRPGQYEYYGNYDDLEAHFRSDHFLCEDESCLAKKFIVFQIEAELKRHNTVDHGGRMSRSQQTASLQIQSGFQVQSRRGRRRSSQPSYHSYAVDDGYPLLQPMSSSGGSRLGESSVPPLSVQSSNRGQTRLGQNSESNNLRHHQTSRSAAAAGSSQAWPALRRGGPTQASVASSIQSSSASPQPQSRTLASAVGGCTSGSSLNLSNAKRNHHTSSSTPQMSDTRSLEQPSHSGSPPVSAVKNRRSSSSSSANAKVSNIGGSDPQSDNKSLVDKIRASLGDDEELFKAFKDTSGKYRHGIIDARTYLEYVKGYGLSHLVLDMARLCPDPKRQKELVDAHNACLSRGNDSSQAKESCGLKKNKGKAVKVESSSEKSQDEDKEKKKKIEKDKGKTVVDSSSGGGGVGLGNNSGIGKQFKKTPKFLRARLGEKSVAAILASNSKEPEAESKNDHSKSSQSSTGELQLRGAWRRGSAKLFS